ncbi:MAG: hemerythrin domain-containing protein [Magnetococcales bacterium]|nr:hemerythrin domain-containing protein [Magnetococcales bacterium]
MPERQMTNHEESFSRVLTPEDFRRSMLARLRNVGIPTLHDHHKDLVEIMVLLYAEVKRLQHAAPGKEDHAALRRAIDRLKDYANQCFREEEKRMREAHFPGIQAHLDAHHSFIDALLEVEGRLWRESATYVVDLLHLVVGWLFDHVNLLDMTFARFTRGEKVADASPEVRAAAKPADPDAIWPAGKGGVHGSSSHATFRDSLRGRLRMTGIETIDREHQQLLELVIDLNTLIEGLAHRKPTARDWQTIDQAIAFMHAYGVNHFRGEEAFMRDINYPDLNTHTGEHKRLLERLHDLTGKLAADRRVSFVVDLNFFLVEWLLTHTVRSDYNFAVFARDKGLVRA